MGQKSTEAINERIAFVIERRKLADSSRSIARKLVEKFGVCTKTAWDTIKRAKSYMGKALAQHITPRQLRAALYLSIQRRELMFRRSLKENDIPSALRVEQDLCRLLRLYPEQRTIVEEDDFESMTDAELERIAAGGRGGPSAEAASGTCKPPRLPAGNVEPVAAVPGELAPSADLLEAGSAGGGKNPTPDDLPAAEVGEV